MQQIFYLSVSEFRIITWTVFLQKELAGKMPSGKKTTILKQCESLFIEMAFFFSFDSSRVITSFTFLSWVTKVSNLL